MFHVIPLMRTLIFMLTLGMVSLQIHRVRNKRGDKRPSGPDTSESHTHCEMQSGTEVAVFYMEHILCHCKSTSSHYMTFYKGPVFKIIGGNLKIWSSCFWAIFEAHSWSYFYQSNSRSNFVQQSDVGVKSLT